MPPIADATRAMMRGVLLKCPACAKAPLYAGYNRVVERCPSCGSIHEREPGEWTGAVMFAQGFFGMIALGGWFAFVLTGREPVGLVPLAWLVGWGLVGPLVLYPSFKGAWIGLLHATRDL